MKFITFVLALIFLVSVNALPQLTASQCVNLASSTFKCNPSNLQCPQQLGSFKTCGQNCLIQAASAQNDCFSSCLKGATDISVIGLAQNLFQCINPTPFVPPNVTYDPKASNNTYTTHFDYCRTITQSPCYPVDYDCINSDLGVEICIGNCYATTNISSYLIACVKQKCTSAIDSIKSKLTSIIACASSFSSSSSSDPASTTQQPLNINQCVALAASTFQCNHNDQQCPTQLQSLIACGQNCLSQPSNTQITCLASCLNDITNISVLGLANSLQQCVNPTPQVPPKVTHDPDSSSNTYTTHFDYCKTITLNNCNPVDYTCQNQYANIQTCFQNCYSNTSTASNLLSCAQKKCSSTVSTISSYISLVVK
ncbi:hypothetical protein ABPG72_010824 [Tetrahymena utriculariae]